MSKSKQEPTIWAQYAKAMRDLCLPAAPCHGLPGVRGFIPGYPEGMRQAVAANDSPCLSIV